MPRLLRPHIPLEVRVRVVLRQLGEMWPDDVIRIHEHARSPMKHLLAVRLAVLAELLQCTVKDLRLDHDPALGAREKVYRRGEHVGYLPAANDPEHLRYRPHGAEFQGSHLIKTNVRGDGAQYPDRVLIKRNRRRERKAAEKPAGKRTRRKAGAGKPHRRLRAGQDGAKFAKSTPRRVVRAIAGKPVSVFKAALGPKREFQSRPIRSGNRWPPKGSQKFRRKP